MDNITFNVVLSAVKDVGFPIIMVFYLMFRFEKVLKLVADNSNKLIEKIDILLDKLATKNGLG